MECKDREDHQRNSTGLQNTRGNRVSTDEPETGQRPDGAEKFQLCLVNDDKRRDDKCENDMITLASKTGHSGQAIA